ncbi:sugar ABC transporter substrate-binding protein [Asanoa sp. WMMD1127]|uniref:sugar ABC transporter substrate-binding protein n=1 Tax=Asanoa sp. WMMD1127 TaxID=3016107 RepID=UPI0024162338|nr:sugar ABC transporter substrate-binding protein [Asanoa sp. WMMD1127]MDG4824899.1 sugar ABC transporter substrate-binding protein [Asanoa sp. WMMD1127]
MTHRLRMSLLAVGAAAALTLAACSSSGGRQDNDEPENSGGGANTPRMTVAFITHSAPGDTFWDLVRKGAEDAARKDNVELQYQADPDGPAQANLVQSAIDKKVDGIAVTLAKPDAMKANVTAAAQAGIPVVALNGGIDAWQGMGVLGYFGQDERIAGRAAGQKLTSDGGKKALCVIHEQGNVGLEARCDGAKDSFANTEKIYVTGTDMPGVQAAVTSKLQQDKAIDRVLTMGAPFALAAVQSVKDSGSSAKVVTFDTNKELVAAIKSGDVQWAVDQQPYLQGYLAVDSLWLYKTNGNTIGGGQATLTGPAFIDSSNVASVEQYANNGKR